MSGELAMASTTIFIMLSLLLCIHTVLINNQKLRNKNTMVLVSIHLLSISCCGTSLQKFN